MQNHKQSDRLSWGDTVFLHLEREGMPLNVASICLFEGEISLEDCVQSVSYTHLDVYKRQRQASSSDHQKGACGRGNRLTRVR